MAAFSGSAFQKGSFDFDFRHIFVFLTLSISKNSLSNVCKNFWVFVNTVREHSDMTSDVLGVFLTYLP